MKIDLGCGPKKRPGYFGIDKVNFPGVDLVWDCNNPIPLEDNCAEEIIAIAFLEHIDNDKKIHIMNEIFRLLKPGGTFFSKTPSTDGRGAFQDPTHTAYWNENSFLYYTHDEYRNLYGIKAKFDIISLSTSRLNNRQVCWVDAALKANKPVEPMKFSIVCASNNDDVLRDNLLKSRGLENHQLILKRGSKNVPTAYNEAMKEATQEITIFVHHDVILPDTFFPELEESIRKIDETDKNWGVLGVAGCLGRARYGYLLNRTKPWGNPNLVPHEVETLDELLLITKKEAFQFCEKIPSTHHMFGPDVCMQARNAGQKCYAILAYCIHNCAAHHTYPQDFWDSAMYLKQKWSDYLPITTTCTTITEDFSR